MLKHRTLLFCAVCLALAWRFYFVLAVKWDQPSGDEAVAGLMAKHIAEGRESPVFFYGQAYFGALEPYLTGLLFRLLGFLPNLIFVWPIVFGALIVLVEYELVREIAGEAIALASALVFALAPHDFLRHTLNAGGGFGLALLMQLATVWLFVRLYRSDKPETASWLALCCLAGLLCWVWQLFIPLLAVLIVLLLLRRPSLSKGVILTGVAVLLVSASPFWLYNLTHSGASFVIGIDKFAGGGGDSQSGLLDTVRLAVMNRIWNRAEYMAAWISAIGGGSLVLLVVTGMGLAILGWRRQELRGRLQRLSPVMLLLILALALFVLGNRSERYLQILPLLLYPCALIGLAALSRRLPGPATLVVVMVSLLTVYQAIATAAARPRENWYQTIDMLYANQLEYGYSDFWNGYPITFLSGESIIIAPLLRDESGTRFDRYPRYTDRVNASDTAFILLPQSSKDRDTIENLIRQTSPAVQSEMLPARNSIFYRGFSVDSPVRRWMVTEAQKFSAR